VCRIPGGGRDFPHPFRHVLRPPIQYVSCLFPGVKRPVHAVDNPPLSSAEVKGRIALKTYAPPLGLHGFLLGKLPSLPKVIAWLTLSTSMRTVQLNDWKGSMQERDESVYPCNFPLCPQYSIGHINSSNCRPNFI